MPNIFKNENIKINLGNYSDKTSLINLELLVIDILLESKSIFQSLLNYDFPNIGSILTCYFSEVCVNNIIKAFVPIIESNTEKVRVF